MKRSLLKKRLALSGSVSLVTLFLIYSAGSTDRATAQISLNEGNIHSSLKTDTTKPNDPTRPLLPLSSKVTPKDKAPVRSDTIIKINSAFPSVQEKQVESLSSSKSAIIFRSQVKPVAVPAADTLELKISADTAKPVKKKLL